MNGRFAGLTVGQEAMLTKVIGAAEVDAFAEVSGDFNPLHVDEGFARGTEFGRRVAHGLLLGSYVSTLIGMRLPGPGALWAEQRFQWRAPVFVGDTVHLRLWIAHKSEGTESVVVEVRATNQDGATVMEGRGTVKLAGEGEHASVD